MGLSLEAHQKLRAVLGRVAQQALHEWQDPFVWFGASAGFSCCSAVSMRALTARSILLARESVARVLGRVFLECAECAGGFSHAQFFEQGLLQCGVDLDLDRACRGALSRYCSMAATLPPVLGVAQFRARQEQRAHVRVATAARAR